MPNKYRMTQTLLSSWLWSYVRDDGYESLMRTLSRQREPPTEAMLNGVAFESAVNHVLNGGSLDGLSDPAAKWNQGIIRTAELLRGAQQQVTVQKDIIVDGVCFNLYGILDFLKAGIIYDTKFSSSYYLNKYLGSPQHSAYFYLVPEAYEFQYVICDGKFVCRETYRPEDTKPIETYIRQFMQYLDRHNLVDLYCENFDMKTYYSKGEKK